MWRVFSRNFVGYASTIKGPMKLSAETMKIISATAPVMKEHGLTITKTFYPIMFEKYPEAKRLFNQSNQRDTRQAQSLATAVYVFAQNIESLTTIDAAVRRIAHKHAALKIQPHMYAWVGESLLEATRKVLGPAATPEIMQAWTEAYGFLAQIFIDKEAELTKKSVEDAWEGWKSFVIAKKVKENREITSFYLEPKTGRVAPFLPGQYLTLKTFIPGQDSIMRHYSISCAPNPTHYRISVKREGLIPHQGLFSTYLGDYLKENDTVELGAPFGDFFLNPQHIQGTDPLILLSGGVGVTPLMSMLEELIKKNSKAPIYWFHGSRNGTTHLFRSELEQLLKGRENAFVHVVYENPLPWDRAGIDYHSTGRLDHFKIKNCLPSSAGHFYFCGPPGFMIDLDRGLQKWGVPAERINFEFFGPWQE